MSKFWHFSKKKYLLHVIAQRAKITFEANKDNVGVSKVILKVMQAAEQASHDSRFLLLA